jgi:hypothetical protein
VSMHGTAVDHRPSSEAHSARGFRSSPHDGDVLASRRTARADFYTIGIVPDTGHIRAGRYSEAIGKVQELAERLGVDGWFTCDHTHFARVAMHRTSVSPTTRVPTLMDTVQSEMLISF